MVREHYIMKRTNQALRIYAHPVIMKSLTVVTLLVNEIKTTIYHILKRLYIETNNTLTSTADNSQTQIHF